LGAATFLALSREKLPVSFSSQKTDGDPVKSSASDY